jgi:hypothetical protein
MSKAHQLVFHDLWDDDDRWLLQLRSRQFSLAQWLSGRQAQPNFLAAGAYQGIRGQLANPYRWMCVRLEAACDGALLGCHARKRM